MVFFAFVLVWFLLWWICVFSSLRWKCLCSMFISNVVYVAVVVFRYIFILWCLFGCMLVGEEREGRWVWRMLGWCFYYCVVSKEHRKWTYPSHELQQTDSPRLERLWCICCRWDRYGDLDWFLCLRFRVCFRDGVAGFLHLFREKTGGFL